MCGFRGGTWNNASTNERVSDRNNAANVNTNRNNERGARFAKTTLFIESPAKLLWVEYPVGGLQ